MALRFQSVSFRQTTGTGAADNRYSDDRGLKYDFNGRFRIPPDISDAVAASIAEAAGGFATKEDVPCPIGSELAPRKLIFIRSDGSSVGVPIGNRTNLITARNTIKGLLGGDVVVCVKLEGEEFASLNDVLSVDYQGGDAVSSKPTTGGKQHVYSGIIQYESDPTGTIVFTPVKVNSDKNDDVPTNLGNVWDGCVGDFESAGFSCGKGSRRKHRRYLLDFSVDQGGTVTERKELPVKSSTSADIFTCGQNAATLVGLYCIGYKGESNDRFHLIA